MPESQSPNPQNLIDCIRNAPPEFIIAGCALILFLVDMFLKPLSAVGLGLIIVALSPWLLKFIKTLELPGGVKFEFRERLEKVTEKAKEAGLLVIPGQGSANNSFSALNVSLVDDPTLALANLRIELERKLTNLAIQAKLDSIPKSARQKAHALLDAGVLSRQEASVIFDLLPLLNAAVHSAEYSREAATWALTVGPELLAGIDSKIDIAAQLGQQKRP